MRAISPADELIRLTEALAAYPDQHTADAIRLLLLTGARRGEVLSLTWDQIDFESGTWTKPGATTKQKTEHVVPLSAPALQLLAKMRETSRLQLRLPRSRQRAPRRSQEAVAGDLQGREHHRAARP